MALNSNALVTLNQAKSYLKIPLAETSKDAHVEFLINAASEYLERECDRVLKKKNTIVEYQDGRKQNIIVLKQWPIISVSELRVDNASDFTDATTLVSVSDYRITDEDTALVMLNSTFPTGYRNIKITYSAGFDPVPFDLQDACLWVCFWKDKIRDAQDIGRTSKSKEGETISYLQDAPKDVKDAILRYKRTEFVASNASIYNG